MEDFWLAKAKRLQAIACTGLAYCDDDYERERLQETLDIANGMLARLATAPVERIAQLSPDARAYPTPKVDVRAAVIRDGRILLVQERNNGRWTLPGGFAEIGYSAAENAEKEVMEEAGLKVRASALYGVRHKAKGPFAPDVRDFYKLYFLCQRLDDGAPAPGPETADAAYFAPDRLPHLCRDRVAAQDIERAFAFMARPDRVFLD